MNNDLIVNKFGALWSVLDTSMLQTFGGTSPSTAAAILTLHFHAPQTGTALSRILGLSQPATVRLVEKLVAADIVARTPRTEGKEIDLVLTPAGQTEASALLAARHETLSGVLSTLSQDQQRQLETILDTMLAQNVDSRETARFLCRFCDHGICDGPVCPIGCRATALETEGTNVP